MKRIPVALTALFSLSLISCGKAKGRINFELNGGKFTSDAFSTDYLEGPAGEKIRVDIPDCEKEGYYFVGWMEKDKNGKYRAVDKRLDPNGKDSYYLYPYGTTTLYAYFEPLVSINFNLGIGKDRGASLVAPENDKESFSDNHLAGYVSKKISNDSYLPTVSCETGHLTFEYWYTKYPLVAIEDDNKVTHYKRDRSSEEGIYPFNKSFGNNTREFPLRDNTNTRTLYASYVEDPKITLHYGIEGKQDYTFQAKDTIEAELKEIRNKEFSFDYSKQNEKLYYPSDTKVNRFAGFFIDEKCTSPFYRNSSIGSSDFDLYLKWNKKVNLTLDYDGGKVGDKTEETFTDYYSEDVLGSDFQKAHIPSKANALFISFTLNGKDFDLASDALPIDQSEVVLTATYTNYPILSLSVDYPEGFTGNKAETSTRSVKAGDDISSILTEYETTVGTLNSEDHLYPKGFFAVKDGEKKEFSAKARPDKSLSLTYVLDYEGKRTIKSFYNPSSSYVVRDGDREKYSSFTKETDGTITPEVFSESSFPELKTPKEKDSATYLFDGLFQDEARTKKFSFPVALETSHKTRNELTAYRKRTKAITLTINDYNDHSSTLKTIKVVPGSRIADYTDQLPAYQSLYIEDGGVLKPLSVCWPSTSSTIYLKA